MILIQTIHQTSSLHFGEAKIILQILISSFFSILFLQSGVDKIIYWKPELSWFKEHFSKTFLKKMTPMLLLTVTILEVTTGALCVAGVICYLINRSYHCWIHWSSLLSCFTIICLFFGQRIAKDYAGAASLAGYFIVSLLGIYLSH